MKVKTALEISPEKLICAVRDSLANSTELFRQGRCYELHLLLRSFWKDAVAWYDPIEGHVYTRIDGAWYDINGKHQLIPKSSKIMSRRVLKTAHRWGVWSHRSLKKPRIEVTLSDKDIV